MVEKGLDLDTFVFQTQFGFESASIYSPTLTNPYA
jgi:hypothetical protein